MNPVGNSVMNTSVNRPVGNAYHCQNPQFSGALTDGIRRGIQRLNQGARSLGEKFGDTFCRSAEASEAGMLSRAWTATRAFVTEYIWEPLKSAYRATANACGRGWEATKEFFTNLFKKAEPAVEETAKKTGETASEVI